MTEESADNETIWYVYVVRCADGSLYTGSTTDIDRRIAQHNGEIGGGARYTRARQPVVRVYSEYCDSRSAALKREAQIKSLRRKEKEHLIKGAPE
ncbi:MAG: GIY-YIG nuclease family protein [Pseudomonadota bacterium]